MAQETAFIDYYNDKCIIPVSQPVDDKHFRRRNYLYSTLGLNLASIRSSNVLEFGPGGGYNAQATCKWNPVSYTLVDATKESLKLLNIKRDNGELTADFGNPDAVKIIESTILSYESDDLYDLVICEGVIPNQTHPETLLKHSSQFTRPGGLYLATTISATSLLSETCRKVFLPWIKENTNDFEEQINKAAEIFSPHLNAIGGELRPPRDWVLDNILHEVTEENRAIFTMSDIVRTIGDKFQFHGSSPRFLVDDRFYKLATSSEFGVNEIFLMQYDLVNVALIDMRVPIHAALQLDRSMCIDIEHLCRDAWLKHLDICGNSGYQALDAFFSNLEQIKKLLSPEFEQTKLAISDFLDVFPRFIDGDKCSEFSSFSSWWGRGQQNISLIRNSDI